MTAAQLADWEHELTEREARLRAVLEVVMRYTGMDHQELAQAAGDPEIGNLISVGLLSMSDQLQLNNQKLQQREEWLEATQRVARIGSWEWDLATGLTHWSSELCRLFETGIDRKTVPYAEFEKLIHADDLQEFNQRIANIIERGQNDQFIFRIVTKTGRIKFIESSCHPVAGANRKIVRMYGTDRDVTEELRDKQRLERLSLIAKKTSNIVIVSDPNGKIEWVNDAFQRTMGFPVHEVIGKNAHTFAIKGKSQTEWTRKAVAAIAKGLSFSGEIRKKTRYGTDLWLFVEAQPLFNKDQLTHYFYIETDITHQKGKFEKLEKSELEVKMRNVGLQRSIEKERRRIAHEIHDDLGQKLMGIKMLIGTLLKYLDGNVQALDRIRWITDDLNSCIDKIRHFTAELHPNILDTLGLIPALRWLANDFETRTGIKVVTKVEGEATNIDDNTSIGFYRICQEALNNVLKHAVASDVTIHASLKKECIRVSITDNGIGFNSNDPNLDGFGLFGMRERARLMAAEISINGLPSKGTQIVVTKNFPLSH